MDADLVAKVKEVIVKGERKHVRPSDVLACIEHESHFALTFNATDRQYRDNLHAAAKITGLKPEVITKICTIQAGPHKGQIAKFRCEPGYWAWAVALTNRPWTPTERFLLSCSFGLGQKMTRWLVTGSAPGDWMSLILQFMGSSSLQITYCAGDLERLLAQSKDDRALAFTRYNAGSSATKSWRAYLSYGVKVAARAAEFEKQIKEGVL